MTADTVGYDTELRNRLRAMSREENQGESLRGREFGILTLLTLVLPLVALVVGWFA